MANFICLISERVKIYSVLKSVKLLLVLSIHEMSFMHFINPYSLTKYDITISGYLFPEITRR